MGNNCETRLDYVGVCEATTNHWQGRPHPAGNSSKVLNAKIFNMNLEIIVSDNKETRVPR